MWPVSKEDSACRALCEIKRFKAVLYRETYPMQRYRDATSPGANPKPKDPGAGYPYVCPEAVQGLLRDETFCLVERLPLVW
jgi:hypothetical protein